MQITRQCAAPCDKVYHFVAHLFSSNQNIADVLLHPLHVQRSGVTDDDRGQPS